MRKRKREIAETEVSSAESCSPILSHSRPVPPPSFALEPLRCCGGTPVRKRRKKQSQVSDSSTETKTETEPKSTVNSKHNSATEPKATEPLFYLNTSPWLDDACNPLLSHCLSLCDIFKTVGSVRIRKCVISSFHIDLRWLCEMCPVLADASQCAELWVFHGQSLECQRTEMRGLMEAHSHWRIQKAATPYAYGTHHSKFIIMDFAVSGVRVAISTANFLECDWFHKTNAVYCQDFPHVSQSKSKAVSSDNDFGDYLYKYLLKVDKYRGEAAFGFLKQVDFGAANGHFVASAPGCHHSADFGYPRLRHLVSKCCENTGKSDRKLVIQCSSVGSLTPEWLLQELAASMFPANESSQKSGDVSAEGYHQSESSKRKSSALRLADISLLWPTPSLVRRSVEGYSGGLSLCLPQRNAKAWLRPLWHHFDATVSGRSKLLPHIKSYTALSADGIECVLLTSANLSKAAWGKRLKDNVFIRSYELGLLFEPRTYARALAHPNSGFRVGDAKWLQTEAASVSAVADFCTLESPKTGAVLVPLPMRLEASKYLRSEQPWVWDVAYNTPDIFGDIFE